MRIDTFMVGAGISLLALAALPFSTDPLLSEILFSAVLAGLGLIAIDNWLDRLLVRFFALSAARQARRAARAKETALEQKTA